MADADHETFGGVGTVALIPVGTPPAVATSGMARGRHCTSSTAASMTRSSYLKATRKGE